MSNNVYYSYKSKENRNRQNRLIFDQRVLSFDQPAIFSLWAASVLPTAGKMRTVGKIVTVLLTIVLHRMKYSLSVFGSSFPHGFE